jgi:hypothetical protein
LSEAISELGAANTSGKGNCFHCIQIIKGLRQINLTTSSSDFISLLLDSSAG